MKIRSAVPENGCLIFCGGRKMQKKNICKTYTHSRPLAARMRKQVARWSTRMVQLPATAAIEYVATCYITRTITRTKTKTVRGGTFVRGSYARYPQIQCVYAPWMLSVPSIVAWRTNKKTNIQKRETRPLSSAGSWPPLPKFSGYVEVVAHYIFHLSTIWVRPIFAELGPKNPHFAIKANEYMSP